MWMSSSGACAMMGHMGALGTTPSKLWHCWYPHTSARQSSTIMGHQNCSCIRAKVLCWPWWPASWWTPFKAAWHEVILCSGPNCGMCGRGCILPCLHCHSSTFSTMCPFLGMGSSCECIAISCRQPTQHQSPGLLPYLRRAWMQTLLLEHLPHSQGAHAHPEALR